MIKIFAPKGAHPLQSSAGRCLLTLEEIGQPYEIIGVDFSQADHKKEDYLKFNPNGKIPSLDDNGFILWESLAIDTYLAEKYKPELLGKTPEENALINQWNVWSLAELQPHFIHIMMHTRFLPEEKRNLQVIEDAKNKIIELLGILNKDLDGKEYLVGGRFTLADLHTALGAGLAYMFQIDTSNYPNLTSWLKVIMTRPAFKKLQG